MKPATLFKDQLTSDLEIIRRFKHNIEKSHRLVSLNREAPLIGFNDKLDSLIPGGENPTSISLEPVPLEDFVLSIIKTAEGAKIFFENKKIMTQSGNEQNQIVSLLSNFCREAKQITPLLQLIDVSSGDKISKEAKGVGQKLGVNPKRLPKHLSKLITSICLGVHEHTEGDILYNSNLHIEKQPGSKQRWNVFIKKNEMSLNSTVPPQEYYFIWVLGYARLHNCEDIMKRGELLDEQIIMNVPEHIHRILTDESTFAWNRRIGGNPTYIAAQQSKMKSVINSKLEPEFIVLEKGHYRLNFKIKSENIKIPHLSRLPK